MRSDVLSRQFKKQIGITFLIFINSVRIDKAKELLIDPDRRIKEISHMVGFSNPEVFSKVFKKATHSSPRIYRKRFSCQDSQK